MLPLAVDGNKNYRGYFQVRVLIFLYLKNTVLATQIDEISDNNIDFDARIHFDFSNFHQFTYTVSGTVPLVVILMLINIISLGWHALDVRFFIGFTAIVLISNSTRSVFPGFEMEIILSAALTAKTH